MGGRGQDGDPTSCTGGGEGGGRGGDTVGCHPATLVVKLKGGGLGGRCASAKAAKAAEERANGEAEPEGTRRGAGGELAWWSQRWRKERGC